MSFGVLKQSSVARSGGLNTSSPLSFRPLSRALLISPTLIVVSTLLIFGLSAGAANSETLIVGDGHYQTIQAAIASARDGDTIDVPSGTYSGNILLNKRITLAGTNSPVLRGEGSGSVITVTADGCTIQGFTIEHSGGDLTREDSGILLKSSGNVIEDNRLRDILYGIYLFGSPANKLRRNQIHGRPELEEGDRGAGLHLWNSPDNVIEDNTIVETRDGIYVQSCNGNAMRRNRITRVRYGLHYMFSDRNIFEDNFFSNNVAGAAIMYSNDIQFRRNAFVHNRGFSSFGILFQECNQLNAEDNYVVDNATGIFMEALRQTTFRRNTIANNDVAIQMFSSSDANVFTENNFIDNLSPLQLIGRSTTTKWSENGRGNFWSDYDGYDLNGDERGDVPQKIQNVFEYLEGNHPRLRIYLDSPAAKATAAAERSFPILRGSGEIDDAPLMKPVPVYYEFAEARPVQQMNAGLMMSSIILVAGAGLVVWKQRLRQR